MRLAPLAVPLLAASLGAALTGCLTIGPQALSTDGLAPLTQSSNAARGTDFSDRMILTGLSVGAEIPGLIGLSATTLSGTQRSTDAVGQTVEASASLTDATLSLGYPVYMVSPRVALLLGGQWTLRSTQVGGNEGTSFILAPRAVLVGEITRHLSATAHAAYDVPVIDNEMLLEVRGTPVRAGMSGVRAGVNLTYTFGLDWF